MSLFADCKKERENHEVIEEPWGFIEYHIVATSCEIDDLYIVPSERLKGRASSLVDRVAEIALKNSCTHLWSGIYINSLNANDTLRANLAYGFVVRAAENGRIILAKQLGGL